MNKYTTIMVPYMHPSGSGWKYMSLLCEYNSLPDDSIVKIRDVYNIEIDKNDPKNFYEESVQYIGYSPEFILKENPKKYTDHTNKVSNITSQYDRSKKYMRIYFPIESLSTYYRKATKYYVGIYTYVNGVKTFLFSNIIDSFDNCACQPIIVGKTRYQEYTDINILDIETYMKNEEVQSADIDVNEYLVNITVQPIYECIPGDAYFVRENTMTGSSFIQFIDTSYINIINTLDPMSRSVVVSFNKQIKDYILNTYFSNSDTSADRCDLVYRCLIYNNVDRQVYVDYPVNVTNDILTEDLATITIPTDDILKKFDMSNAQLWGLLKDQGLYLGGVLEVNDTEIDKPLDDDGEENYITSIVTIKSHPIALTDEYLKVFINDIALDLDYEEIKNKIDEMSVNINVINKIEVNNGITVSRDSSRIEGMVKPVFYKTYDLENIVLHKNVYENILINLDEYKNSVDTFNLKINNTFFMEAYRTDAGVMFQINGAVCNPEGTFYVCDGDGVFITSGKYTCV